MSREDAKRDVGEFLRVFAPSREALCSSAWEGLIASCDQGTYRLASRRVFRYHNDIMSDPQGTIDFFISYRGRQTAWALWINWVVRSAGYSTVLMDEFQVGTTWTSNMRNAARDCRRLIPLYSDDYWSSGACVEEFDAYWRQHLQNGDARFLLPLEIHACVVPDMHAMLLTARLYELGRDASQAAILKVLEGIPPVAPTAANHTAPEPAFPGNLLVRHPAPTLRAIPRQLPIAASKYFGRAAQLADLKTRLRDHQRTDVWGGPGMGKTALAAEAVVAIVGDDPADLAASPFPHGVVFLDLYRHHDLQTAWQALANTFDDALPTDMPAQVRATRACTQRRALIILEGAEELRDQLELFISVISAESTLLVLTREESQTAAARRIKLDKVLKKSDALALLRYLAGKSVSKVILAAVQERLGGHPLALTWAGSQLGDATQPPKNFLRDLQASPLTKLTEPGGNPQHTLRWMFDRSVRLMAPTTRTVLAAVSRISEPFDEAWAEVAGGSEADLQRLVQLSFLTLSRDQTGWQFDHALAAQFARDLPLPEGLLAQLGQQAITGIATADARCQHEGTDPLGLALAHATSLLEHDGEDRILRPLAVAIIYQHENHPIGIRRGRLDFALGAVQTIRRWLYLAPLAQQVTPEWQRELSVCFGKLGELANAQGNLPETQLFFGKCHLIAQQLAEWDPTNACWQRDLSLSLNKLGGLAIAKGNLPEAEQRFGDALRIMQQLAKSDPTNASWQRDLSASLEKLGNLAITQGNLPEAQRLFGECHSTLQRLVESAADNAHWQRDLSVSLEKLGDIAITQGNLIEAERLFAECHLTLQRLTDLDPANAAWRRDVSVSLERLGDLARLQGNLFEAQRIFGESLLIAQQLAESDPKNAMWQRDLSVALIKVGELAYLQGNLSEVQWLFGNALRIAEQLAESDPANAQWQRDLSVSLNKLGELAIAQGNLPEAQRLFRESLRIFQELAESDPANAQWQFHLGISYERLGELATAQGNLGEARRFHSERQTLIQRLAGADPANAQWQRDLSVSLSKLGEVASLQGNLPEARRLFGESLRIAQKLADSDPANTHWQRDLSYSYYVLAAKIFMPQERWSEALPLLEQSQAIDERLAASDPTNVMWQNDVQVSRRLVAEVRGQLSP